MATEEELVINAICKNKDVYLVLGEDNELFGAYGDVMKSIKDYYNKYRSVPSFEILKSQTPELEQLTVDAPTKYYVEKLKEKYVRNKLGNILFKAAEFLEGNAPIQVLEGVQSQIAKLSRQATVQNDLNIMDKELALEHYDEVFEKAQENGGAVGIPTGFVSIDSAYQTGMAPGHLIYAMGFSGAGKSWIAALMAIRAFDHGVKPMIISLEMTPEATRDRIYTMMAQGYFGKNSELTRGEIKIDKFEEWYKENKDKPEFIVVSGVNGQDVTPNYIQAKIDQHQPGFIVIDYQQLMMDNEKNQQMTQRMTALSRELKLLAVSNNIPVMVITSVTDSDSGRDRPPTIDQMAWAKALEYSSDMVYAVHQDKDTKLMEIVGRKNRFGDLWDMFVEADFNSGIFKEMHELSS